MGKPTPEDYERASRANLIHGLESVQRSSKDRAPELPAPPADEKGGDDERS